jgi:CubicO group peptidase (beta-lactamase class C family)
MTVEIHGFCDERVAPLRDAFAANFADGLDLGASLAFVQHGKPLLDVWAGWANLRRTRPWTRETIGPLASTTKIATALCLLMVIDRGLVDLDATVATYWPEFAQDGKERVTVREALSHQAGVPGFDSQITRAAYRDWAAVTAHLAAEPHWFNGESVLCYHASTSGLVLGEILRRVDGRPPARFFDEEVARPAGIDFQIGLRAENERVRASRWYALAAAPPAQHDNPLAERIMTGVEASRDLAADLGSWEAQRAGDPSSGGYATGLGIARLAAIFANGGELDGVRYLSKALVDEATREQAVGEDPLFGELHMGFGFGLDCQTFPAPTATSFHWGGNGGSLIVGDQASGASFGYVTNNFIAFDQEETRFGRLWGALSEVMKQLG